MLFKLIIRKMYKTEVFIKRDTYVLTEVNPQTLNVY
jgi:hypothetical protein